MGRLFIFAIIAVPIALSACRGISPEQEAFIASYKTEDTAELCHYSFFPIADPTATQELKIAHYQAMRDELNKRGIICNQTYPNNPMYQWRSMLEKVSD